MFDKVVSIVIVCFVCAICWAQTSLAATQDDATPAAADATPAPAAPAPEKATPEAVIAFVESKPGGIGYVPAETPLGRTRPMTIIDLP